MSEYILPLHLLTLAFLAWNIVRADHLGFLWIRGTLKTLDKKRVQTLHRNTWIGLGGMIITGVLLFIPMKDYLLMRPQFLLKMAFVFTLLVNGMIIGHLQKVSTTVEYSSLSLSQKVPLYISGAVSTIAWLGAAISALFIVEEF